MTTKFSQFLQATPNPPGIARINDVVVGLRGYPSNPINESFNFAGVADTDGNPIVTWSAGAGPNVNYLDIQNNVGGAAVTISAVGSNTTVNMAFVAKTNGNYTFAGTGAIGLPSGTTSEQPAGFAGALRFNTQTGFVEYWDPLTSAWVEIINGAAPVDATFITQTDETAIIPESIPLSGFATGFLSNTTGTGVLNPRTLTSVANTRIVITNAAGDTGNPTFDLATTNVTPGSYNTANITVDAYGRLTSASNGTDIAIGVGQTITQTSHGFTVGEAIYFNGSTYALAKANSTITAEVIGVIEQVIDVNNFVFISVGLITGLSGLTAGVVGWLSDATAGLVTNTIPTTPGNVTKPIWIAISTTSVMVYQERGKIIPNPSFEAFGFIGASSNLTVAPSTGYYTGGTGTIVYTIPSAAAQGDYYVICGGTNPNGWLVQMSAGQVLKVGLKTSIAGGTLGSSQPTDAVNIICVGTNAFVAYGGLIGNMSLT